MSDPVSVDLFVEDRAHEQLLKPLLHRVAKEASIDMVVRVRSARGGHRRAIQEFALYQNLLERGAVAEASPELVVVAIDGNCTTHAKKRTEVEQAKKPSLSARLVPACPDPHIERWYLADLDSFASVVGHRPVVGKRKCVRDHYKRLLAEAVRRGGHPPTLGGVEFAAELVDAMDLYRAGKADRSFNGFVGSLRENLRILRPASHA